MGDQLAQAVDQIFKRHVQSSDVWQRTMRTGALAPGDVAELMTVTAAALRQAVVFLARQIDDPEARTSESGPSMPYKLEATAPLE